MVNVTLREARGLVAPPTGQVRVTHQDGMTDQIIGEVLAVSAETAGQTARLAERLRGATPMEHCRNVFAFVRGNVAYQLDPTGQQLVKTPAAVIGSGFCDCKGYATLTNGLLRELGVPCAFRFVSFTGSRQVTHVYSVAWPNGDTAAAPVVLDACLPGLDQEKPYTYHTDHMTQISRVSGLPGHAHRPHHRARHHRRHGQRQSVFAIHGLESDEEMSMKLMGQGAVIERDHAAAVHGIGSAAVGTHASAVSDYSEAVQALNGGDGAIAGFLDKLRNRQAQLRSRAFGLRPHRIVRRKPAPWLLRAVPQTQAIELPWAHRADREERRIGFLKKLFRKAKNAVKSVYKRAGQLAVKAAKAAGNVYKGAGQLALKAAKAAGQGIVKAGKFAVKVALAPLRLLTKGLLEVLLPKMAPMFLYLFITNQSTIASLPPAAARKRRKAVRFAHFITETVGMKEAHFLRAVRNGIQRQMGGSPEQVLAKLVRGPISGVDGIGILPLLALAPLAVKAAPTVMKIIEKIMALFGRSPAAEDTPTAADAPDPVADFGGASAKTVRKVVVHASRKPASQRGEEPDTYANEMAQEAEENAAQQAVDNEPDDTAVDAPLPDETLVDEAPAAESEVGNVYANVL